MRMTLYGWKSDLEEEVKHFTTDLQSAVEEAKVFHEEIVVMEVEVLSLADFGNLPVSPLDPGDLLGLPVIVEEKHAP